MEPLSTAASLATLAQLAIGSLQRGKHDVQIERVWIEKISEDKLKAIVILANHGAQKAVDCECIIETPARSEFPLKLPVVEGPRGAINALEKFEIAGGGVKEVRGYVEGIEYHKELTLTLKVKGGKPKKISFPIDSV